MNLSKKYSKFQSTLKTLKNETLNLTLIVALKTKFNFYEATIIGLVSYTWYYKKLFILKY